MGTWLIFALAGLATLVAALMVVKTQDLVHAVLWLAVALLGTSALYAVLNAGFLAAIQVLLYTGGVITLMLFAVLLARRTQRAGPTAIPTGGSTGTGTGAALALLFFGLVATTVLRADLPSVPGPGPSAVELGAVLLGPLMLPFEAVSVLLLAAMIGAIVLARRTDA